MLTIPVDSLMPIGISRHMDDGADVVAIDVSAWKQRYPQLVEYRIEATSPGGAVYLPAAVELSGDLLLWTLSASDTAVTGDGRFQVVAFGPNGERKTSANVRMKIRDIMPGTATEEAPEPAQPWVDRVVELAGKAEAAAKVRAKYYVPDLDADGNLSFSSQPPDENDIVETLNFGNIRGKDGRDGKDGVSITHEVQEDKLIITSASGTTAIDLNFGKRFELLETYTVESEHLKLERTDLALKGLFIKSVAPATTAIQNRNFNVYFSDGTYVYAYVQNNTGTTDGQQSRMLCELEESGKRLVNTESQAFENGREATASTQRSYMTVANNDGVTITGFDFSHLSSKFPVGMTFEIWGKK